jgi:hypothetical protein
VRRVRGGVASDAGLGSARHALSHPGRLGRTDDVLHVVMTDHDIQRRKPERDLLSPLAEPRESDDNGYRAFREAIRRQPDYAEAHNNLAGTLSAAGRFEEARYHFEAAIRVNPKYAAARYNYALALARVRRFAEAQRQIEPRSQPFHSKIGARLRRRPTSGKSSSRAGKGQPCDPGISGVHQDPAGVRASRA